MKKRIRVSESDLHRVIKESVRRILSEDTEYADVRSDFYDDEIGATAIDAWEHFEDVEGDGKTVAYVYDDGRVEWLDPNARDSKWVKEEINAVLNELSN